MSVASVNPRPPAPSAGELADAFQAFTQVSHQLSASYHLLEAQVEQLTDELAASRRERAVQQAEQARLADRFERLLHLLPGAVVVLDGAGRVHVANPAAIDLLGVPLLGAVWREVITRAFAPRDDDGHEVSLRDGRRVSIATRALGAEPGQILLLTDLTETRQLQARLAQHQRLSAMGEMAAALAHQIRTPLASALLYTSSLARPEITPPDTLRFAEKIRASLHHLEHLVSDMLIFARGGAGAVRRVVLTELLNELHQTVEPHLLKMAAAFEVSAEGMADVELFGNRDALLGALINLISNALEVCHEAGITPRLRVVACVQDGQVCLAVSDNGPGISDEARGHLFEPFFTTRAGGTGLGLAVVQSVASAHQGTISVESVAGSGSTFTLTLPRLQGVASVQR